MARKKEEYDWLNDPFDDKKAAEELERAKPSMAVGCLFAVAVAVALGLIGVTLVGIMLYATP